MPPHWKTDEEFDAFIREALFWEASQTLASLPDEVDWVPSESYKRKMAPLLADPFGYVKRLERRRRIRSPLRVAACAALLAVLLLAGVWAARDPTSGWTLHHTAGGVVVQFAGQRSDFVFEYWRPTVLPQGYTQAPSFVSGPTETVLYQNANGKRLTLRRKPSADGFFFELPGETGQPAVLTLNGYPAYLFDHTGDAGDSTLLWRSQDGRMALLLQGSLPVEELLATAQSVVQTSPSPTLQEDLP